MICHRTHPLAYNNDDCIDCLRAALARMTAERDDWKGKYMQAEERWMLQDQQLFKLKAELQVVTLPRSTRKGVKP